MDPWRIMSQQPAATIRGARQLFRQHMAQEQRQEQQSDVPFANIPHGAGAQSSPLMGTAVHSPNGRLNVSSPGDVQTALSMDQSTPQAVALTPSPTRPPTRPPPARPPPARPPQGRRSIFGRLRRFFSGQVHPGSNDWRFM